MSKAKKVDKKSARIAVLEQSLGELRLELARAKVGLFRSMRDSRSCPACGGQSLLHIPAATELTKAGVVPLAVHHTASFWGTQSQGPIEYFICRNCKLIESHAIYLGDVEPDGETVIAIEPDVATETMPSDPYR